MSSIIDFFAPYVRALEEPIFGLSSRLNPLYLFAMIPLGWIIFRLQKVETGFWAWLFPREIYTHASTQTDIKLLIVGAVVKLTGFLKFSVLKIFIIYSITQALGESELEPSVMGVIAITLSLTLVSDFCVYWVHRGHHEIKLVWPFHAVHHSAEVMSPITVYRKHPMYSVFSGIFSTLVISTVQGLVLALFFGKISILLIGGVSAVLLTFNVLGSNFRHSHIWISYGQFWSHIFISPAQHQIHHSLDHEHWHKNYGEIFALWDWAFGTLYVPETQEALAFGLSTPDGQRIKQPYPTATDALCVPFREAAAHFQASQKSARLEAACEDSL